jgi:peptide methionine sulfoxide reductase MsrA
MMKTTDTGRREKRGSRRSRKEGVRKNNKDKSNRSKAGGESKRITAYLVSNEVHARYIEQNENEICHGKSRQDVLE